MMVNNKKTIEESSNKNKNKRVQVRTKVCPCCCWNVDYHPKDPSKKKK